MNKICAFIVPWVLLGSLLAGAQRVVARERGERADVAVEEVKKRQPKGEAGRKSRAPKYNRAVVVGNTLEKKLIKGIDKTIDFLKKTANQMPKRSGGRLEMLERILNLTLEQAAYVASDEQDLYDRRWKEWTRAGRKGVEPKVDNRRSNGHWQEVLAISQGTLREFPKGKNADVMAFNAGLALQFLGRDKEAAKGFNDLIKRYPKSPKAGDAFFSLGEYYFERNDFRTAMGQYKAALKHRRSQRYGWALFKLGWCHYNLGAFDQAQQLWQQTVTYAGKGEGQKISHLKDEALRDLIFVFAELKQVEPAIQYFRRHSGEEYIAKFLKLLAETYSDQGEFGQSIKVWKKLLDLYPNAPEAFEAQKEITSLVYEENAYKLLWVELARLYEGYHSKSRWASRSDKTVVADAQKDINRLLLYYPKVIHKDAQKSNDKRRYEEARDGYRLYLKYFPTSRDLAEVKEYLGDIEFFQENYSEAGKLYLDIALLGKAKAMIFDDKGRPKQNIHMRSAKNMLDAFNKDLLPELKELLKQKPDFTKPARALSTRAKNFIKGCGAYVKWYPQDAKVTKNCETFTSELYYRNRDKKMALRYLWLIASKYPDSKEGASAVENIIPLYKGDQKGMIMAAKKLLTIPAYQKGPIGAKLRELLRGVELDQIVSEKSDLKRAKLYEAQARQNPKDKDADKLWNNAAADYVKAGYIAGAVTAFSMIVKNYPSSVAYQASLLQLGKIHDSRMEFEQASNYYLAYGKKYANAKETPAAMQRACVLLIAMDAPTATNTCMQFARRYSEFGMVALEKLTELLWRKRRLDVMSQVISEYTTKFKPTSDQRIVAFYKIYAGYKGSGPQASQAAAAIATTFQKAGSATGEALRYVGEIAFINVQPLHRRFMGQRLQGGSVERLQGSIQSMTASLGQLEQAYGQLFNTKDSYWGVAAFYQLGMAYEYFGNQLKNPPAINGAKPDEVKAQLKASVDELMGKAKEYYSTGLQTSRRFTVFNDWSVQIFNALNRLMKRKVTFEEWVVTPDFAGSEVPKQVRTAL